MKHRIEEKQGATIVALDGDVDLESSPAAREVLMKSVSDAKKVLVDLSGVSYIDSSGVATLVEALQSARKKDTEFALVAVSEPTRRVLELARLDKVFTLHKTVEDGLT